MKSENKKKEIPETNIEQNDSALDEEGILEEIVLEPDLEEELEEQSLEEQVAALQMSLDEMKTKAEEYLDGWQRARAEFANYKKRILRDHTEIHQSARGEVIKLYLDIADDLERALQEKPGDGEGATWADGIEIIFHKLRTRLESEGIKPMNPLGEEFDPNIHEALMKEENDEYESGQIIEVMQEGYWIGDKVLRPALVRVAA